MSNFAENPIYVQHEEFVQNLHALIASGQGDSGEADAIRDEMDDTYLALSQDERDRLGGLSADLYMLTDEEIFEDSVISDPMRRKIYFEKLVNAGNWVDLLKILRQETPWVDYATRAWMRGNIYERLGHLQTSILFYKKAIQLNNKEWLFDLSLLGAYDKMQLASDAMELANRIVTECKSPDAVFYCAWIIHKNAPRDQIVNLMANLIPQLENILLHTADNGLYNMSQIRIAHQSLSVCHLDTGDYRRAYDHWTSAMGMEVAANIYWHEYMVRGQLRLIMEDIVGAIEDFKNAVKLRAQHLFPYFYLAVIEYESENYTAALRYLNKAILVPDSTDGDALRACCWELKAIIMAILDVDRSKTRECFETAIDVDPQNSLIAENARIYVEWLSNSGQFQPIWKVQPSPASKDVRIDLTGAFAQAPHRKLAS